MRHRDLRLINPRPEDLVEHDPLISFSWYFSGRKNCVLQVGEEVLAHLDDAYSADVIDGGRLERAEMLMWFWTLGAYELVRAMCQAKECFSSEVQSRLRSLKQKLAQARMPAAKMEKPGKKIAVTSDRSPAEWDPRNRDLLVGDPTSSVISARGLLEQFKEVFSSITPADILRRHEDSYDGKG